MKKINWFIIGLVGTFLVLFFLSFNKLPAGSYDMKFQSQLWQQEEATISPEGDIALRQKMVGDLIKNILPAKNRPEVIALLGPPTETDQWRNMKPDHLIYLLGRERGYMSIDHEWLFIEFEGASLKKARVATD